MAINGIEPLQSDNAKSEYRRIVFSIIRRVNGYIEWSTDANGESPVPGDLYALLVLCRADPKSGGAMAKGQVAEWRRQFMEWAEAPGSKIPRKLAAGYRETMERIFEELERLAEKKPRDFWYEKTDD